MTDIVLLAQQLQSLQECIINLRLSTEQPHRLIVVAEETAHDLIYWLEQQNNIHLVSGKQGMGVAEGYNLGAAAASSERIVFMRDYMYVTDGWLDRLTACMERHGNAALVGPVSSGVSGLQNMPLKSENVKTMHHLSEGLAALRPAQSRRVPRLLSHLLMVRKTAFAQLGGFDERFTPESYEDDDLCYRALLSGYELYIAEDCLVRYERTDPPYDYNKMLEENKLRAFEKWGFDVTAALFAWKQPVTVSLCMIVKNEEMTLEQCLSSVQDLVDEIVIVDTGSDDRTKEIAGRYTDRIFDFEWINDFAAARNFAFQQARMEYILWLDADDVLLPKDARLFRTLKSSMPWDADAVSMTYNLAFDESGNVTSSLRRNRLVKRTRGFRWIGVVHEYLEVYGNIVNSEVCVTHDRKHTQSSRNLHIYENKEASGQPFSSRDLYYYANELLDHKLYERALDKYEQFLARKDGWMEDVIAACGKAADCLHGLGRTFEAKTKALSSFAYALPRAENCCRLGYFHMEAGDYEGAVYWYKTAASLERPKNSYALIQHACWTWLPHLQLCVCYHKLGRNELANEHNELAAAYAPGDSRILSNRSYFQSLNLKVT